MRNGRGIMGGKEINTPVAIGIAAAVLVVIVAVGMLFIGRRNSVPDTQQKSEANKMQTMRNYGKR